MSRSNGLTEATVCMLGFNGLKLLCARHFDARTIGPEPECSRE
jgi:hypothetical protein